MKHTITLLFAFSSIFTSSAIAEVPHIFSSGTPAKASEVNENFQSLDTAVDAVESRRQSDKTSLNSKIDKANTDIGQLSTQSASMLGSINQTSQSLTEVKTTLTSVKLNADANQSSIQVLQAKQGQTDSTLNGLSQQQQVQAGSLSNLNTALGGVSQNVTDHKLQIDKNAQDIGLNKASIGVNKASSDTNKSDISRLKSDLSSLSANVSGSTASIATNTASINTNTASIATNTVSINTNTASIATNTASISTNTQTIEANKTKITNVEAALSQTNSSLSNQASTVADNVSRTSANQSAITTNETGIQANQSAIQTLNTDVNNLKPLAERTFSKLKPTYTDRNHAFLDPISLGDATFRLVKLPFIEFSTGDRYTLTVPTVAITDSNNLLNLQASLNTSHVDSTVVTNMTVSGFPAIQANLIGNTSLNVVTQKSNNNHGNRMRVVHSASASVTVIIGETALTLTFNASKPVIDNENLTVGDFDYAQNVDWNAMKFDNQLVTFVDDLIDYIVITKVTP